MLVVRPLSKSQLYKGSESSAAIMIADSPKHLGGITENSLDGFLLKITLALSVFAQNSVFCTVQYNM